MNVHMHAYIEDKDYGFAHVIMDVDVFVNV